jgi:hypothetical protein
MVGEEEEETAHRVHRFGEGWKRPGQITHKSSTVAPQGPYADKGEASKQPGSL